MVFAATLAISAWRRSLALHHVIDESSVLIATLLSFHMLPLRTIVHSCVGCSPIIGSFIFNHLLLTFIVDIDESVFHY
jgi:hypothetical protein